MIEIQTTLSVERVQFYWRMNGKWEPVAINFEETSTPDQTIISIEETELQQTATYKVIITDHNGKKNIRHIL